MGLPLIDEFKRERESKSIFSFSLNMFPTIRGTKPGVRVFLRFMKSERPSTGRSDGFTLGRIHRSGEERERGVACVDPVSGAVFRRFITKRERRRRRETGCAQAMCSAKVSILTCFLRRSSWGTGPKTRVPMGSPCLLTRTTALSSNLISLPSQRPRCIAARTTTP